MLLVTVRSRTILFPLKEMVKTFFVSKITPSPIINKENRAFPVALRKFKC